MPFHPGTADQVTQKIRQELSAIGAIPRAGNLVSLTGGRTNRLWRVCTAQGTLVVKLYPETPDNPLFGNDPAAEARLLRHLDGTGLAPRFRASVDTTFGPVLLYTHVDGAPWQEDPAPVAAALARLHALPPPPGPELPATADGSAALARQTYEILALCPASDAVADLRRLQPVGDVAPSGVTALLHGDVVPGNIIHAPRSLTLIDWQCPARGDPVHDLAVFLSPSMQLAYRGSPLTSGEEDRFLTAYGQPEIVERYRVLAPWFHWRMAAYCLWRVSQNATDYRPALTHELARLQS